MCRRGRPRWVQLGIFSCSERASCESDIILDGREMYCLETMHKSSQNKLADQITGESACSNILPSNHQGAALTSDMTSALFLK